MPEGTSGYVPPMLGSHQDMAAPDYIEPMIGWRTWNLTQAYDQPRLVSPSHSMLWIPGQAAHALCTHDRAQRLAGCRCGINSFASEQHLINSGEYRSAPVWGSVRLWGEVHEFEIGMRAQYGAPNVLFVDPRVKGADQVAAELGRAYGVPCEVRARPDIPVVVRASPDDTQYRRRTLHLCTLVVLYGVAYSLSFNPLICAWARGWQPGESTLPSELLRMLGMSPFLVLVASALTALIATTCSRRFILRTCYILIIAAVMGMLMIISVQRADSRPQSNQVSEVHAAKLAFRTGKAVHVKRTGANSIAWALEYRTYRPGECNKDMDAYKHTRVCMDADGKAVTISPRETEHRCTTDKALGVMSCVTGSGKPVIEALDASVAHVARVAQR
jgi:hypothetical protein